MARWEDNVKAAELWQWASGPKSTGLPNRNIELLKILPAFAGDITGGLDLDVVVEMYATRTGRMVSHKIIRNYLSELSTKNMETYYEDAQGTNCGARPVQLTSLQRSPSCSLGWIAMRVKNCWTMP